MELFNWIPACAGMTKEAMAPQAPVISAKAEIQEILSI